MQNWQQNWRVGLLPGLSITGIVLLARLLGALQLLEWKALDLALKWRPAEPTDSRITLVAITEEDIQNPTVDHPITDQALANLIQTLQTYNPRVIGIDIFRDGPKGEGYSALIKELSNPNVVGTYRMGEPIVSPLPVFSSDGQGGFVNADADRIGFADAIVDDDGFLRRSQLAEGDRDGRYHYSLTVKLAQRYLNIAEIDNGLRNPEAMRFAQTEIPHFQPNSGGYVRTDNGGNQTLINFRAGAQAFNQVSYAEVISGQVAPELLQDRLLLIGYTAESVKDDVNSGAIAGSDPSAIPGITLQAHAISQILSAVYDERPFLKTLPDVIEYLLIIGAGCLGIVLAHWQRKPPVHIILVMVIGVSGLLLAYLLIIASWWLPLIPALAVFWVNAVVLYPFYQAQLQLQRQLKEQDKLIDQAYNTIHNGPLQIIAQMLKHWPEGKPGSIEARLDLQKLNHELRGLHEVLKKEMKPSGEKLAMMGEQTIDLQLPLHNVLYETYCNTIERYQSFFTTVTQIRSFEPMADSSLTVQEKRAIGRFLEEALNNIYKHAEGTTRITVTSCKNHAYNIITIIDNGRATLDTQPSILHEGDGTRQAKKLAHQLGGKFERKNLDPQGTHCELRWPIQRFAWQRWWAKLWAKLM
jgi:CHASE2 domain-containing sensor protein/two-component sensor histidine kinase